jgi:hypothetical protein
LGNSAIAAPPNLIVAAHLRASISALHRSKFSVRAQITFMYCDPPNWRKSVRAIIVCALNEHMAPFSTCGPRTRSNAVSGWHSERESVAEQIKMTIE